MRKHYYFSILCHYFIKPQPYLHNHEKEIIFTIIIIAKYQHKIQTSNEHESIQEQLETAKNTQKERLKVKAEIDVQLKAIDATLRTVERRLESFINSREDVCQDIKRFSQMIERRERDETLAIRQQEKSQKLLEDAEARGSFHLMLYLIYLLLSLYCISFYFLSLSLSLSLSIKPSSSLSYNLSYYLQNDHFFKCI